MEKAGLHNRAARRRSAGFIALLYVVFASAWIVGSSYLLEFTIADPALRWRAELGKGLAFVLTSGLLLFFLLLAPLSSELHKVSAAVEPGFRRYRGIGIGLLLLAPLIAISIYYFTSPGVKKQTYLRLGTVVNLEIDAINLWIEERRQDIDALRYSQSFRDSLSQYLADSAPRKSALALLEERLQVVVRAYNYESISLLDTQLDTIVHVGVPSRVTATSAQTRVTRTDTAGSDTQLRMSVVGEQLAVVEMIAPVLDGIDGDNTALLGYIRLEALPGRLFSDDLSDQPGAARTLETLLVDLSKPEAITGIHLTQIDSDEPQITRISPGAESVTQWSRIVSDGSGTMEMLDHHGNATFAVIKQIPDLGWFMLAKIDHAEAFAPLRSLAGWVGIALLAIMLAINVILFQIGMQQRRIYQLALIEESERFLNATIASLELHIAVLDSQGVILATNNKWVEFAQANGGNLASVSEGVSYLDVCRRSALDGDEDAAAVLGGIEDVMRGREAHFSHEYPCHSEHELRWFVVDITVFPAESFVRHIVVAHNDVTQQKLAEQHLQRLNRFYATLSEMNKAIIRAVNPQQILQDACRIACVSGDLELVWVGELTEPGRLKKLASHGLESPFLDEISFSTVDDSPQSQCVISQALGSGSISVAQDLERIDAPHAWYDYARQLGLKSVLACPLRRSGEVWGVLLFFNEQSEFFADDLVALLEELAADLAYSLDMLALRKEREQAQAELLQNARIIESTHEGLYIANQDNEITLVNPAFCEMMGYAESELIGKSPDMLKSQKHDEAFYAAITNELRRHGKWQGEIWNTRQSGETFPAWLSLTRVKDDATSDHSYIAITRDITARKEYEEQIRHIASHDLLTDLPNRLIFENRTEYALAQAERTNRHVAVLFVDLDRFKLVNDTLGHDAGDEILKATADRIVGVLRKTDTVCRVGGDEFVILLAELLCADNAAIIARKINETIAEPLQLGPHQLIVTASIGVAVYPENSDNVSELTQMADAAMLVAKQSGQDAFHFYSEEMARDAEAYLDMQNELRFARKRGELYLVFQPQLSIDEGHLVGMEALLRWRHPRFGQVPPDQFIAIAEDSGQIVDIGQWVLAEACRQRRLWADTGIAAVPISVNVSALQFQQDGFIDTVIEVLDETRVEPGLLELELTESLLMIATEKTLPKLKQLRKIGVRLAIDDFGTGYSSLAYLRQIPAQQLKIDKSFIQDVPHSMDASAIVKVIVDFGKSMEMDIMAEGVETLEQSEFLREVGCPHAQGYYYSRPLDAMAFAKWMEERRG